MLKKHSFKALNVIFKSTTQRCLCIFFYWSSVYNLSFEISEMLKPGPNYLKNVHLNQKTNVVLYCIEGFQLKLIGCSALAPQWSKVLCNLFGKCFQTETILLHQWIARGLIINSAIQVEIYRGNNHKRSIYLSLFRLFSFSFSLPRLRNRGH